jgi:predicted RNA-binding protein
MCEANAYWVADDGTTLIMRSVDIVEPEGTDRWRLVDIFGEQKSIKGQIKAMNLVDHKIIFKRING